MRLWKATTLVSVIFMLHGVVCAQTQTPTPTPADNLAPASASTPAPAESDLSITAHVTARELLFRKVPNPRVEFPGNPARTTLWEAERENLPAEVRPGVTYRDLGIRLRITSVFADIDRIVAEALGELPDAEDATPPRPNTAPPTPDAVPPTPDPARPENISRLSTATPPQASPANVPSEAPNRAARRGRARRGHRR